MADLSNLFVYCQASGCCTYGPDNDPTGEKWNALLRVADVENAYFEGSSDGRSVGAEPGDYEYSDTKRDLERRMKP
jgi:hypothetical protein